MWVDSGGQSSPSNPIANLAYFEEVMERFGLAESFASTGDDGSMRLGVPKREMIAKVKESTLILNIMGFLKDETILGSAPRRVFLDIDPGYPQMWKELGLHDAFVGHDDFVTVGANLGRGICEVPTSGVRWIPTRPPVVLEHWTPESDGGAGPFTSVGTWRGAYGPIEYRGRTYGARVHEFRQFADVPRRAGGRFEFALDIHPQDIRDIELLRAGGWSLTDPRQVAGDPWAYRDFVRTSAAEFMVAKGMYVKSRSGWFSDRSACYLASGRPVVAQDTGLKDLYPTGKGLVLFKTPDEAVAAVEEIRSDYDGHSRAARRLAEEFFDSDMVLAELLSALGIG